MLGCFRQTSDSLCLFKVKERALVRKHSLHWCVAINHQESNAGKEDKIGLL